MTAAHTTIADPYPSRLSAPADNFPRTHPAVWGKEKSGPFTPIAVQRYGNNGFHIEEGMLTPAQVQQCWSEVERLQNNIELDKMGAIVRECHSGSVRSMFAVHEVSPLIDQLIRTPRILNRARQILGSEVYIHQSRINCMPGFSGSGFYWHSDFETWHSEDGMPLPRALSMSIALTDNYPFNGGLMLMPGSHKTYIPCVGETPKDNYKKSLQRQQIGVPDEETITKLAYEFGVEQFTGPAGSALFFDSNTMHGSANNITPFPRANIFVVFNSVENALREPYAGTAPRPQYLGNRDATPLTPVHDSPFD
ncbi:ectoine hydroxylase [Hoyosella rhizosphaerae]|uniref:Ectoine hydroxylase n=1 Tax=Hoyosella rhizosphaerae TaxID=1755582 RepID=A0A916U342_9ACTN|nr:ectoine hydroxylase [Hoyosella rhizosphaerae]MBN4926746.1 ectoine hydroxylase [Hoyosella rhizosphaerae]GGC56816.1 ectoine hydroxylase [Hoyosella rhizosphaerae]